VRSRPNQQPVYSLIAKPENKTYADLKGKLIGIAAENGSITLSIRSCWLSTDSNEKISAPASSTARRSA